MHNSLVKAASAVLLLSEKVYADYPLYSTSAYQEQAYGLYPNQSYVSSNLTTPVFQVNTNDSSQQDPAKHVFLSPRGTAVGEVSPMIFSSSDLSLVWADPTWGTTFGIRVQEYNNEDYITFWRGKISSNGYGSGSCVFLDSSYRTAYNVTTKNLTVGSDIHECQLTTNGTALLTAYQAHSYDLSSYDIEDGWIADSYFQEVDIASGDLLFSWRASDHFSTNDSYADPGSTGSSEADPYDFFHINSIEKDDSGNYLISSRHLHILTYINGTSGQPIWVLGGKLNDFDDKSDGNATNFAWQHDARWQTDDLTEVTLFDNGASDWENTESATRGLWLKLNYTDMSVSLEHEYLSPEGILSVSQGSVQPLSNGNVLMGYGADAAIIEYTREGTVVLDAQFGIIGNTTVQSYRAYKQNWTAQPYWNPSIASTGNGTDNTTIYLSWNGATEVKTWYLLASANDTELTNSTSAWKNVTKSGFETDVKVPTEYRYVRAAALDVDGVVLGSTSVVDVQTGNATASTQNVTLGAGSSSTKSGSSSTTSGSSSTTSSGSSSTKTGSATTYSVPGCLMITTSVSLMLLFSLI